MEIVVDRPDYRLLRFAGRLELRPSGKAAGWLGLGSLVCSGLFFLLSNWRFLADGARILQGTAVLLVGCSLLLLSRWVLPARGWVFAGDAVSGPSINASLAEVGLPATVEVQIGSTTLYCLVLPVRGRTFQLLTDLQPEPVQQALAELQVFLQGRTGNDQASPAAARLSLRRLLAGATLLSVGMVCPIGFCWWYPSAELEGMRVWALALAPLWAGFWESTGYPVLPPARGPLVWGNYAFITAVVIFSSIIP